MVSIKIQSNVWGTPQGNVRSWGIIVQLDNGKMIMKEFFSREEVQAFIRGIRNGN